MKMHMVELYRLNMWSFKTADYGHEREPSQTWQRKCFWAVLIISIGSVGPD